MSEKTNPLLKTKLFPPPWRPDLVARPRLISRLDEALGRSAHLVLVSARAGSGKTTLVREWLQGQDRPFGWLSLDEQDNDPMRFLSYMAEALRQAGIVVDLGMLEGPEPPSKEALAAGLLQGAGTRRFVLVLDDFHTIQDHWIHTAIEFLVDHASPGMCLVLTTRADPPWPLASLRARGQLVEIRDAELRFTGQEAQELLNAVLQLNLSPEAVATIEGRTEGWIAGLQMAGISLHGHRQKGDLEAFIESFGGTHRFILDYLLEEVLDQQPPSVQDFLVETSILERMCAGLCDVVRCAGGCDSHSMLAELEHKNLFVIPLDEERRWYRYHHLFADLLRSLLRQRRSEAQVQELHRRAAEWYLDEGYFSEALSHFMSARDFERAADLIDQHVTRLLQASSRSQSPLLLSWIDKLPAHIKQSRPWIDVYRANMLALNLQLEHVDAILDDVESRLEPGSPRLAETLGHIAAVRAYSANLHGDAQRSLQMVALAKSKQAGETSLAMRAMLDLTLADTCFATDDMQAASRALSDLVDTGEQADQVMMIVPALCELAAVRRVQGSLGQAKELYERAHQCLLERDAMALRVRCSYEFGQAELLRECNQLEAAYAHVQAGLEHRRRAGGYNLVGELALMRILQARGDTEAALRALHDAGQAVQTYPFQLSLMIEFRTARLLQWLAAGDIQAAVRGSQECRGGSEREQIALARLLLAQDRPLEAFELLDHQGRLAEAGGRTGRLIEILAVRALSLEAQALTGEADQALSQALSLAWPEGFIRTFLDLGEPLHKLLRRTASPAAGNAGQLLDLLRKEAGPDTPAFASQALADPLTGRELEVLRLLAEGLSNKAIAEQLVVTPGTVKQHLKNISRKLDAHSRLHAVRRAQELKLL